MTASAEAATTPPTNLTDKQGVAIEGEVRNIVGSTLFLTKNGLEVVTCELDQLSDESRERVLAWSLPYVLNNQRFFRFSSTTDGGSGPPIGRMAYQCTASNQSPMDLPADLQIAYNIHMLFFRPRPVEGTDAKEYQYAFEHDFPASAGYAPAKVIPSGQSYSFDTTPIIQHSSRPGSNDQDMSFEEILSKTIIPDPDDPASTMRPLRKYVLEVRIYYKDQELFRYVNLPEAEAMIKDGWRKPSASRGSRSSSPSSPAGTQTTEMDPYESPFETPSEVETSAGPSVPLPPIPYESIVIIDVDDGTGTGFLMEMKGKQFLLTNIHVIAGASSVTCKTVDGKVIQLPEQFFIAKDRDLALIPINFDGKYLETLDNLTDEVAIGDDVTVFGNEAGASVVTQLTGKVKGIGPNRIEVDAKFVEGNSGSPAIHHKTGNVIGIAAYYIEYELPKADRRNDNRGSSRRPSEEADEPSSDRVRRRFAERVDNPTQWEHTSFRQMRDERDLYNEYLETLNGVVEIAVGINQNHRVLQASEGNRRVSHLLDDFHAVFRNNKRESGSLGNQRALDDLRRRLFTLVEAARDRANDRITIQYYRDELERMEAFEGKVRDYMEGVYTR